MSTSSENEQVILECFLHLHGQTHSFRELFPVDQRDEAKAYIEQLLTHKFAGELPPGEWKETPEGNGIMYWPGDPFMGDNCDGRDISDAPRTKGYIIEKPLRESTQDALEDQSLHSQIYRVGPNEKQNSPSTVRTTLNRVRDRIKSVWRIRYEKRIDTY